MIGLAWFLLVIALAIGAFTYGGWLDPWAYWLAMALVLGFIAAWIVRILQHKRLAE